MKYDKTQLNKHPKRSRAQNKKVKEMLHMLDLMFGEYKEDEKPTPLEALQEVREQLIYYKEYAKDVLPTKAKQIDDECEEELNIIETTLKKIKSPLTKEYLAYENKNLREKYKHLN